MRWQCEDRRYMASNASQICEIIRIIDEKGRIVGFGRLNMLTYLEKASYTAHPEVLLALLVTCQQFLRAKDEYMRREAPDIEAAAP